MKKIYLLLTVALAAALAPTAGRAQGGDVLVPEQSVMGINARLTECTTLYATQASALRPR